MVGIKRPADAWPCDLIRQVTGVGERSPCCEAPVETMDASPSGVERGEVRMPE
jgi:hypothetical protein